MVLTVQEQEKRAEAQRQLQALEKSAKEFDIKAQQHEALARKESGGTAKRLERQAWQFQAFANELRKAKKYATGEYKYSSVKDYAIDKAQASQARALQRLEYKAKIKRVEAQKIIVKPKKALVPTKEPKLKVTITDVPQQLITPTGIYRRYPTTGIIEYAGLRPATLRERALAKVKGISPEQIVREKVRKVEEAEKIALAKEQREAKKRLRAKEIVGIIKEEPTTKLEKLYQALSVTKEVVTPIGVPKTAEEALEIGLTAPYVIRRRKAKVTPETTERIRKRDQERIALTFVERDLRIYSEKVFKEAQNNVTRKVNVVKNELQVSVNAGRITIEEANKKLEIKVEKIVGIEKSHAERKYNAFAKPRIAKFETGVKDTAKARAKDYQLEYAKFYLGATFVSGIIYGGIASVPYLGVAVIGTSLIRAAEKRKEIGEFAREHPTAFYLTAGAGLAGALTGAGIVTAGKYLFSKGIKPDISHSISKSKATQIGKDIHGNTKWNVETTIKTSVKNPKTGKVVGADTQVYGRTIVAPTKAGALKIYSRDLAHTISEQYIRAYGFKPTIKLKITHTKVTGKLTLSPTQVEKVFRGRGEFIVRRVGITKVKVTPKGLAAKLRYKPTKQYEALADIWSKQVGTGRRLEAIIIPKKKIIIVRGKEYAYNYKILVDLYGKKGAAAIMRGKELGSIRAFVPEELFVALGKKAKFPKIKLVAKIPRAEAVKKIVDVYGKPIQTQQIQKAFQVMPPKAAAELAGQTTAKILASQIAAKVKPIKVLPKLTTAQLLAPVGIITQRQRQILKQQERLRQKEIQKGLTLQASALGVIQKEITAPKVKLDVAQILGTGQKYRMKVPQITAPKVTPIVITPPVVPPITIPKVPPPIVPTLLKETPEEKRKRKKREAKLRQQQRAYQASVGAKLLVIEAPKAYLKKMKKLTGLELRPVIK